MTYDPDPLFAALLRKDAPAERDPVFRVEVLCRLERAKYRRRLVALLALALVVAAVAAVGVATGGAAREATGVLLIGVALTAAYFIVTPALTHFLSRLRS
jgi:uncharacterized membrane protein